MTKVTVQPCQRAVMHARDDVPRAVVLAVYRRIERDRARLPVDHTPYSAA